MAAYTTFIARCRLYISPKIRKKFLFPADFSTSWYRSKETAINLSQQATVLRAKSIPKILKSAFISCRCAGKETSSLIIPDHERKKLCRQKTPGSTNPPIQGCALYVACRSPAMEHLNLNGKWSRVSPVASLLLLFSDDTKKTQPRQRKPQQLSPSGRPPVLRFGLIPPSLLFLAGK